MPAGEVQTVDLGTLSVRDLAGLRDNLDAEVQNLTQSVIALQRAAGEFGKSGQAIEKLRDQKEGQPMLVPVTNSLYVNGTATNTDKVLIDIGTGYFIEDSSERGIAYCKRKVNFLKEQIQKVMQELKNKQQVLSKVSSMLQQKNKTQ